MKEPKEKQGEYRGGFWYPKISNKQGNNQHTPKEKLKKKEAKHIYSLEEVKSLYQQKREAYRAFLSITQLHSEAQRQLLGYNAQTDLKELEKVV
jgi:hypothetical protein